MKLHHIFTTIPLHTQPLPHTHTYTHTQSDYFRGLSKDPVISSLSVYEELDSSGEKALNLELYCTVRGKDKVVPHVPLYW